MSQKSLKGKTRVTINQTMDTSHAKSHSDKRTSRFLNSVDNEDINSDQVSRAFFILLDVCQDMIQLHNDDNRQEIENAIKNNDSYEQVAQLVCQKMSQLKRDYVTNEYKLIKQLEQNTSEFETFELYAKLQDQNQRWKSLFFQEARTVIEQAKSLRQQSQEIEQNIEYIMKLETKMKQIEDKYLEIFSKIHNQENVELEQFETFVYELKEKNEYIQLQLTQSRTQALDLSKRLQDEIFKTQASQELRISDLQYIMALENQMESN